MELVFEILKKIVDSDHEDIYCRPIRLDGYQPEEIGYHLYLMDQAGLLEANVQETTVGPLYEATFFVEMKWDGYEFLEALQNDSVFEKFKAVLKEKGGNIPFKIAEELLLKLSSTYFLNGV